MQRPEVVTDFLNILNDQLKSRAQKDYNQMQMMKDIECGNKVWEVNIDNSNPGI